MASSSTTPAQSRRMRRLGESGGLGSPVVTASHHPSPVVQQTLPDRNAAARTISQQLPQPGARTLRFRTKLLTINSRDQCPAFRIDKFVRPGARIDQCPRVTRLALSQLNTDSLKCTTWEDALSQVDNRRRCHIHDGCLGHLQSRDGSHVALPHYCINTEDVKEMSDTDKLNVRLMDGDIDGRKFGAALRSLIRGKRGHLKYKMVGFVPSSSMRGVATCVWPEDPRTVFIPRKWANRVKIITRERDKRGLKSPYYTTRAVKDGDRAILSRCPALTHDSVQCVTVKLWDESSVGVSPEMCDGLHLDYDGDEVHVCIVGDDNEILAEFDAVSHPLAKFAPNEMSSMAAEVASLDEKEFLSGSIDFMLPSTLSATELSGDLEISPLHKKCRSKKDLFPHIHLGMSKISSNRSMFESRAIESVQQIAESHLRVSEGYVLGRQLKHIMFQSDIADGVLRTQWSPKNAVRVDAKREIGYAAVKLSSAIASKVQQALMDKAKHGTRESSGGILASLISGEHVYNLVFDDGRYFINNKSVPTSAQLITNIARDSVIAQAGEEFERAYMFVKLGCAMDKINATEAQMMCFAHAIMCVARHGYSKEIVGNAQTYFLSDVRSYPSYPGDSSNVHSTPMAAAVSDDVFSLDKRDPHIILRVDGIDNAVVATLCGNYDYIPRTF